MPIYVIYTGKCLSERAIISKIWGKPSLKQPSQQRKIVGCPNSHGEWEDSVCFEKGARMDSFAAVLTMLSCSSMYIVICVKR